MPTQTENGAKHHSCQAPQSPSAGGAPSAQAPRAAVAKRRWRQAPLAPRPHTCVKRRRRQAVQHGSQQEARGPSAARVTSAHPQGRIYILCLITRRGRRPLSVSVCMCKCVCVCVRVNLHVHAFARVCICLPSCWDFEFAFSCLSLSCRLWAACAAAVDGSSQPIDLLLLVGICLRICLLFLLLLLWGFAGARPHQSHVVLGGVHPFLQQLHI